MARLSAKLPHNIAGEFFVDSSCIDCDQCRRIAPGVFRADGEHSVVYRQPETPAEVLRAQMALVTCPTASIGTVTKHDMAQTVAAFPEVVDENVHFCGFASESSFGASSYLIVRPEGNVLVDSPRFAAPLVRRIEELGGVSLMFLTHRDDVADHEKFHRRFDCRRVMHNDDITKATTPVEMKLTGRDPFPLGDDLLVIPTPGHTRGHQVLLYRERFLFSGDHVWWNEKRGLSASRSVCWYSWPEQTRSMERLLDFRFEWVLPGHGGRHRARHDEMRASLEECVKRMKH
jgi:glyoxylase-like metal-dependent hydrolase (beta-lactamase superfamily II)/ferredoxin